MEQGTPEVAHPQLSLPEEQERVISERDLSPPRGNPFPIVGIGASAGGLEAFAELLREVPPDMGMALVLVQHLDPHHESLLADILAPQSSMPVVTVHDGVEVQPNTVYVIPPNTSMMIEGRCLKLVRRDSGLHLPIDIFFRSLAAVQKSRAIGVVLSGNASDGSAGLQAIKAECGLTFAQDEATARFSGMPRNAAATGAVDHVLSPAQIGRELARLSRHPFLVPAPPDDAESETLPDGDEDFSHVLGLLATATRVDFSHYKPTTVRRRIGRRMIIQNVNTLREYASLMERQPTEARELYRDLLISVTGFFRDPEVFAALIKLFSGMFGSAGEPRESVRIWVPGCATGEEVYTLAICLTELLKEKQLSIPIQIFGTDLSELALERARAGAYGEIICEDVSAERLKQFFTKVDSGYQVSKVLRESCIFARHDVTTDPPFSRVDLISCRNLLIYLGPTVQKRVMAVFHYALKPAGLLLLGTAETVGGSNDLFASIDRPNSIYQRKSVPARLPMDGLAGGVVTGGKPVPTWRTESFANNVQSRFERVIQTTYSPDAVLVDGDLQILQFRGHTSAYLDPTPGDASLNLLRMAREDLVMPLRRALKTAANTNRAAEERIVSVHQDGTREDITIEVTPLAGDSPGLHYWMIVFTSSDRRRPAAAAASPIEALDESQHTRLERELAETREYLHSLREDYEAYVEELQAANEEARSANEELQSTNEELGTTKEELQSTNEELTTVNEELLNRHKELTATYSDLKNLLGAVSVAIVMVDSDLRIRRFNTVAEKLLDLGALDVGRPIGYLRGWISTPDLEDQVHEVIDTLHASEREIRDDRGHWYSLIVRPYRTVDDRIAGAVITVQDIDPLKQGLAAAEEARDYAENMIETVREPLVVLNADLRVQRATAAFYETFLVSRDETEGRFFYDLGNGQWNRPRLRELIGAALFRSESFQDYEVEHDFPHVGRRTMRLNARPIARERTGRLTLLLAIEDVTQRKRNAEIRFQRLFETSKDGLVVVDMETECILDVNSCLLESTGFGREDLIGKKLAEAAPFAGVPELTELTSALRLADTVRNDDVSIRTSRSGMVSMELLANVYNVGSQTVAQLGLRDVTMRKEQEETLRSAVEEKAVLVREIHHRVKNNLQVIVSLLSLQATYTTDPKSIAAFQEAEGRVKAIAHIHENLYATPDLAQIEFSAYLTNLVKELVGLHATVPDGVGLELVVEEIVLDMEQAIPLGLIANELIVNGLKHGIDGGRGTLRISLTYQREPGMPADAMLDEGWGVLQVGDDGPGLPADIDLSKAHSMGFKLLYLLVKQLRGKVTFSAGPGASVQVEFPLTYR